MMDLSAFPLLAGGFEGCERIGRASEESDGLFGVNEVFAAGERFFAMLIKAESAEARQGERQALRERYVVVTPWDTKLRRGDLFRRDRDGMVLLATANTRDGEALSMSGVPIAKTTAERWALP